MTSYKDINPLMKERIIKFNDRLIIKYSIDGRYKYIIVDGYVIALCPSLATAEYIAKMIKFYLDYSEKSKIETGWAKVIELEKTILKLQTQLVNR